jgi:proline dehydrogenase
LNRLRAENKGGLFAYSVEVDENAVTQEIDTQPGMSATATGTVPPHKKAVAEILHSIDVAAAFEDSHPARLGGAQGRKTWVAIKIVSCSSFVSLHLC